MNFLFARANINLALKSSRKKETNLSRERTGNYLRSSGLKDFNTRLDCFIPMQGVNAAMGRVLYNLVAKKKKRVDLVKILK